MANTGRMNLLEEVGRIDAERMNPNRRAEKRRVVGELNRGYKKGGRVKSMGIAKRGGGVAIR
jgi:SLT domain-containing protein|tara:strand:- start:751 stop:936 length:186 start_codon:yes stop_codon:yes gene_type:complete